MTVITTKSTTNNNSVSCSDCESFGIPHVAINKKYKQKTSNRFANNIIIFITTITPSHSDSI
jgi:hypothetical protein